MSNYRHRCPSRWLWGHFLRKVCRALPFFSSLKQLFFSTGCASPPIPARIWAFFAQNIVSHCSVGASGLSNHCFCTVFGPSVRSARKLTLLRPFYSRYFCDLKNDWFCNGFSASRNPTRKKGPRMRTPMHVSRCTKSVLPTAVPALLVSKINVFITFFACRCWTPLVQFSSLEHCLARLSALFGPLVRILRFL